MSFTKTFPINTGTFVVVQVGNTKRLGTVACYQCVTEEDEEYVVMVSGYKESWCGEYLLSEVKDIRKMFECFKKQNINFVELLFTQYYILNPIYEELFAPMLDNAEKIARYNNYASVNCMCGMAFEKYKALTYPYPSIVDKIEKYGCDPKQLHHILRLKDFIERYCNGESYRTILIPKNKDMLLDIKSNYHYELEYSKNLAKETCEWIKQYKQEYMENNPLEINTEAKDVMEKVMTNLITFSIKNEVCRNE